MALTAGMFVKEIKAMNDIHHFVADPLPSPTKLWRWDSVKYKFLLVWRVGLKGFEVEEEDGCNLLRQHWHSLFEGVPVVR